MVVNAQNYPVCNSNDKFGGHFRVANDGGSMGKQERKQRVLAFLVDSRLALPRTPLYRNLAYNGADFSESSLQNYLRELRDEGYVERIDAEKFAKGTVVVSDDDPGYWIATSDGSDYIKTIRKDQRDEINTDHL